MTLHNFVAHSSQVNDAAGHASRLRHLNRNLAQDAVAQSRGPAEPYNDKPRCGPPSGNSTDGETVGIRALGKWKRSHKGLDPASAAILEDLIGGATQGVAKRKQSTIADRTGLSVSTVGRRLDLLEHVGLISREKRTGKHNHRLCDAILLMLECQPVKLSGARSKELVRQFNGTARSSGDTKNKGADGETDCKNCRGKAPTLTDGPSVNLTEPLSHDVSYFPPVQDSSAAPQSPDAVSAERGSDAPATPSISLTGDQRISSEESRQSTDQGIAPAPPPAPADDSDIDAADEVYRDQARWAGDDDGEYASPPQADSASHKRPVSRPTPEPASTPAPPAAQPAKTEVPRPAGLNAAGVPILSDGELNYRAIIWDVLLSKVQALHKQNMGGYMTRAMAKGRMGKIVKAKGGEREAAYFIKELLRIGPSGNPFDYAQKMLLGEHVDLITARDRLAQPVRYI
ncbi:helix-turn-helix transcriptional regulator [Methylobacterium sp. CM6247]